MSEWKKVETELPKDGEVVLAWTINNPLVGHEEHPEIVRFVQGKVIGDKPDTICHGDQYGNNLRPYCWDALGGPMSWFGQNVSHWQQAPTTPPGE